MGQRGETVMALYSLLNKGDEKGFIAAYEKLAQLEQDQKAVISRGFEGSIKKPNPTVANEVVGPFIKACTKGLIRDYKGLDMLLDAWAKLKSAGKTDGRRLIVAGEFYTDKRPYTDQIERLGLADDVILHDWFVPDEQVPLYFSAADALVLPYRTATQSGVTQIAYNYDLPMIATDVGGLGEIVINGRTGIVCAPDVDSIADALERFYAPGLRESFVDAMPEEKKRFSWDAAVDALISAVEK
jgi:glycosyltransferase involved in cell wall biosynthesis